MECGGSSLTNQHTACCICVSACPYWPCPVTGACPDCLPARLSVCRCPARCLYSLLSLSLSLSRVSLSRLSVYTDIAEGQHFLHDSLHRLSCSLGCSIVPTGWFMNFLTLSLVARECTPFLTLAAQALSINRKLGGPVRCMCHYIARALLPAKEGTMRFQLLRLVARSQNAAPRVSWAHCHTEVFQHPLVDRWSWVHCTLAFDVALLSVSMGSDAQKNVVENAHSRIGVLRAAHTVSRAQGRPTTMEAPGRWTR